MNGDQGPAFRPDGNPPPGPYGGGYGAPPYGNQGYPYGAPGYGAPPVRSADVRPRRLWFAAAGLVALGGFIAAVVMFVGIITGGTPRQTFSAGQVVTVHLSKSPRPGFYIADANVPSSRCFARPANGAPIAAEPISETITVTANGRTWQVLSLLTLPADGTYQVTCLGSDPNATYGVGTPPAVTDFVLPILIPLAGFVVAVVMVIVVALRRRSHRRRLMSGPGY